MGSVGRCALLQWRLIYSRLRAFVGVPCTALVALCQGRVASVFNASPNNQAQQQSCQQCNLNFRTQMLACTARFNTLAHTTQLLCRRLASELKPATIAQPQRVPSSTQSLLLHPCSTGIQPCHTVGASHFAPPAVATSCTAHQALV